MSERHASLPVLLASAALAAALSSGPLLAGPVPVPFAQAATAADRFEIPATDDGLPGVGPIRRYDWFRSLWRERRSEWAKAGSGLSVLVRL